MRVRVLLAALLLGAGLYFISCFQVMAQKAEIQGWDKFKWEMSPEEAKQVSFDYEVITGKKVWEEDIRTQRFCVLKTNSFSILENRFSPEIKLYFFDNKLFKIDIRQKVSYEGRVLHFAWQTGGLSTLGDKLIKKYGTPAYLGSLLAWQRGGKKQVDKLMEIINDDPLNEERQKDHLSRMQGENGFILQWPQEGETVLFFNAVFWIQWLKKPSLFPVRLCKYHIDLVIRYTNVSLQDKYWQESQKASDKMKIQFESF